MHPARTVWNALPIAALVIVVALAATPSPRAPQEQSPSPGEALLAPISLIDWGRLRGSPVWTPAGAPIGRIEDLVLEPRGGSITHAVIEVATPRDARPARPHGIRFSELRWVGEARRFDVVKTSATLLPMEQGRLAGAPAPLLLVTSLLGCKVRQADLEARSVESLAVEPGRGALAFVLLAPRDLPVGLARLTPVPWAAVALPSGPGKPLVVPSRGSLADAPRIDGLGALADLARRDTIYAFWQVPRPAFEHRSSRPRSR